MSKPPSTKTSVTSESFDSNQYQSSVPPPALGKGSRGRLRPSLSRFASWVRRAIFGMLPFLARAPRLALLSIASILLALVAAHELRTKAVSWSGSKSYIAHWQTPRQLYDERTLPAFENAIIESIETVPGAPGLQ